VPRDLHAIERTRRLFGLALGYQPDLSTLASGIVPPPGALAAITGKTAFLLHGTSREDKKWPVEDWIGTARLLIKRGMTPVTTWSNEREKSVAEAIARAVPSTVVVPKSPLADIAAILGRSTLVIGADTGLTHLASAFGLPTVAVFLATEPGLTGPRGQFAMTLLAAPGERLTPAEVVAEADRELTAKVEREEQALPEVIAELIVVLEVEADVFWRHACRAAAVVALDRFVEQIKRIFRFAPAFDHAVDAQLFVRVGLNDLPTAGTADDYFEVFAVRTAFDFGKQISRVVRIDRHL